MGNWIPNDPTLVVGILKISASYSPSPPEGFISPMTWGVEENVIERFARAGVREDKIRFERATPRVRVPGPPSELLAEFRSYYGPTMNAFRAAAATVARLSCKASWKPFSTIRTPRAVRARARFPGGF
jgi:hypothetical protein